MPWRPASLAEQVAAMLASYDVPYTRTDDRSNVGVLTEV